MRFSDGTLLEKIQDILGNYVNNKELRAKNYLDKSLVRRTYDSISGFATSINDLFKSSIEKRVGRMFK